MLHRRGLITGLISLMAAPAIVRVESIMPVKAMPAGLMMPPEWTVIQNITRKAFIPRLFVQHFLDNPMLNAMLDSAA